MFHVKQQKRYIKNVKPDVFSSKHAICSVSRETNKFLNIIRTDTTKNRTLFSKKRLIFLDKNAGFI